LNHLTVPVAIEKHLLYQLANGRWEASGQPGTRSVEPSA
jgi:hypothetical protein